MQWTFVCTNMSRFYYLVFYFTRKQTYNGVQIKALRFVVKSFRLNYVLFVNKEHPKHKTKFIKQESMAITDVYMYCQCQ